MFFLLVFIMFLNGIFIIFYNIVVFFFLLEIVIDKDKLKKGNV